MEVLRQQWEAEQRRLKQLIRQESDFAPIQYIAGVDISFVKESNTEACVCLAILDYHNLDHVVYHQCKKVALTQPYIPGFLAFREIDHILEVLQELEQAHPEWMPQMIMVDGNGILHPRGLGLASHLGAVTDLPTIGVAKNFLWIEDLADFNRDIIRERAQAELHTVGSSFLLKGRSGVVHGACLRSTEDSVNPIYVSVGHRVSLDDALVICTHTAQFRIPEPVRQADKISRTFLREEASQG
ncbi:MAG: endonuclease V [Deltaproteobacteria bacterium]|nr:MAG: endonuclease V [Deltaproteobacteria bacterium]